jgi:DNA polymerase III subunit epsilon
MGIEDFWGASLDQVLGNSPDLSATARRRVGEWMYLARDKTSAPFSETRFVVIDTETSGLDVRHDHLLSIGACVVSGGTIALGQTYYRELRQAEASARDNILVHGIGRVAQLAGEREADALSAFLEFAGKSTLVAFNAPFDQEFLAAAMRRYLGVRFKPNWIDLAELPKALYPADASERRTLDHWLERFSIVTLERHNALADAYCTAQLLLAMLWKARHEGYSTTRDLKRAERNYHWQRH